MTFSLENYVKSTERLTYHDLCGSQGEKYLYVRTPEGDYERACDKEILLAARTVADNMIPTGRALNSSDLVSRFFQAKLGGLDHQRIIALFVDAEGKALKCLEVTDGSFESASLRPRTLVKWALEVNAYAVILAHNHLSGDPEPTSADRGYTRGIKEALKVMDIKLLDHVVVSGEKTFSMAEYGMV